MHIKDHIHNEVGVSVTATPEDLFSSLTGDKVPEGAVVTVSMSGNVIKVTAMVAETIESERVS